MSDDESDQTAGTDRAGPKPALPSFTMLRPHLRAKHELVKLHRWNAEGTRGGEVQQLGKAPLLGGWRKANPLSEEEAKRHMASGGNIGVRLQASDLVIDIDPRNFPAGRNPFREMCNDLDIDASGWPHVHTGGGGLHYYLRKPPDVRIKGALANYPGVEFDSLGRQVLAAGCLHPKTKAYYTVDAFDDALNAPAEVPETLLDAIKLGQPNATSGHTAATPSLLGKLLEGLDPDTFQDQGIWLQLMMACHQATQGGGIEEFVNWSTSGTGYADDGPIIRRRWTSLDPSKQGNVTIATLYKFLQDAGRGDLVERARQEEAQNSSDFETESEELPEATRVQRQTVVDEWVWVALPMRFIRRRDLQKYKPETWKSMYASLKPDGDVLTAVWKGKIPLRKFGSLVYVPAAGEFITTDNESRYNLWRPSGIDAKSGDVSWLTAHLEYLFPSVPDRELVLDYLALLIQRPAEKMHFALLVRGEQGTGKSALGELMRRIIGERNVVKPSNDEVNGKFTAWQEGAQLAIIEELMVVGRLELANRLKPVITDPELRIEEKFGTPYSIPNQLNLLCFTNHRDALKIETGDRRWLVVFSPAKPRDESYYEMLFSHIASDPGAAAAKHFLLNRPIALNPKGTAPATRGKEDMRRLSMGEIEAYLLGLFEDNEPPFDFDLVRTEDIVTRIPEDMARRHRSVSAIVLKFLHDEIRAVQQTRNTKTDARPKYRLWSIRNHEAWEAAGPTERIEAYLSHSKSEFGDIPEEEPSLDHKPKVDRP